MAILPQSWGDGSFAKEKRRFGDEKVRVEREVEKGGWTHRSDRLEGVNWLKLFNKCGSHRF